MTSSRDSFGRSRGARSSKTDAFRPNLPSDPFTASALDGRRPWVFHHEELNQLLSAVQLACKVILILGEPSNNDLDSLLVAPSLRQSLLLIVTSSPPQSLLAISEPSPSVQILRLLSPIALQDPGAHHLLSIFQRAEVVARRWRKFPDAFTRRGQLRESHPGGAFNVSEEYGSTPNSLLSNHTRPVTPPLPKSVSSPFAKHNPSSRLGLLRSSRENAAKIGSSFDALINFVPSSFSNKAIIKYIILLTTLSQTFLVPTQWTLPQTIRLPTTSQSQPTSRSASPTFKRQPRNALKISSFASRFPSLLTSSNVSLPEKGVRQTESTTAATDDQTRSRSHPAIKTFSSVPSGFTTTNPPLSEPKTTRSHIVHVLPSSHAFLPRNQSLSLGPSSFTRLVSPKQESANKSKLLQIIEQFLRSYSYPFTSPGQAGGVNRYSNSSLHDAGGSSTRNSLLSSISASGSDDIHPCRAQCQVRTTNERPAAYVVSGGMLGHKPHVATTQPFSSSKGDSASDSPAAAVVEMLLLGLLDPGSSSSSASFSHSDNGTCTPTPSLPPFDSVPKVWIGHPNDVVVKATGGGGAANAITIPTRDDVDIQEENDIKLLQRYLTMTDGLEEREEQEPVRNNWARRSDSQIMYTDSRGVSMAISTSRPEERSSDSSASELSTASSGDENPSTRTSTASDDVIGSPPQKVAVKSENNRPTLTTKLRRMSGTWKAWIRKSVDVS